MCFAMNRVENALAMYDKVCTCNACVMHMFRFVYMYRVEKGPGHVRQGGLRICAYKHIYMLAYMHACIYMHMHACRERPGDARRMHAMYTCICTCTVGGRLPACTHAHICIYVYAYAQVVDIWYKCLASVLAGQGEGGPQGGGAHGGGPAPSLSESKGAEGTEMLSQILKRREECAR